jgi:D-3-phosphoglycerate dehydrogenase / 2-oxoglutarate reductase
MPEWNILITDGLEESGLAILKTNARVEDRSGINSEELLRTIGDFDALIVRGRTKVTSAVIAAGRRLIVIGRAGVGVDNIDIAAATRHKVTVVNAPLATTKAVAEFTIALMFSLARSIPKADSSMKSGQWLKKDLLGVELSGKVLGVIGMGNIGAAVVERAAALGMIILGYDPLISPEEIKRHGAEAVTINDLYSRSDFITLHVPLTPDTKSMVNGQAFGMMKRGVRIICDARGGVIDETALLGALESGQVAGAALDVFTKEPPGMTALVAHPNVIATPHIAAQTVESQARAAQDIASEVLAALKGETLHWKIV